MILEVFAIHDRQGGFYSQPFFVQSAGIARRTFQEMAADPNNQVGRYPEDFSLYHLGQFDNVACKWALQDAVFICTALSMLNSRPTIPKDEEN